MPFVVGETIGPYRLTEKLGQGGMATVFKAYHANLDRYVAIKVLHPAFMEDPSFLARFQREARVVAKLDHANIVPIYDFAEHEGRPYLVMKYIEGQTLKYCLDGGSLPLERIVQVVDAVGAALAYAHQQDILHRDVKPSNVILADDGQIYLADFGLARIASAGESTLSSDTTLGTPQYISPEQALGKRDLDAGTDIYSFGVVLYELVVGKVPFSGDTPFAVIHDHIYTPLPLPHLHNPDLPEEVERVLLKALAKERGDRYSDVLSLIAAFKQAIKSMSVSMSGPNFVSLEEQPTLAESEMAADGAMGGQASSPVTEVDIPSTDLSGKSDVSVPEDTSADDVPSVASDVLVEPTVAKSPDKASGRKTWLTRSRIVGGSIVLVSLVCLFVVLMLIRFRQARLSNIFSPETPLPGVEEPQDEPTLPVDFAEPPLEHPIEEPLPPELLYEMSFDGEMPGWELQPGWEQREGALCGEGHAFALNHDLILGDFVETFRFKLEGSLAVSLRGSDLPRRRYIVNIDLQEASLSKQLTERTVIENLEAARLKELPPGVWHEAVITVQAESLALVINGEPVWEFWDERPLPAGTIAFEVRDGTLCVDDLFILLPQPDERP